MTFHQFVGLWKHRALLLAAMIWRRLLFRTTFIAITGSGGKSTAKETLGASLKQQGPTFVSPGNTNATRSVSRNILRTRPWHRFAVLEVGTDRPGWIRRTASIVRPNIAVILCVRRLHSDRFDTIEDTVREKASLLTGVPKGGMAILNADDERVTDMAEGRNLRVIRFGLGDGADVVGSAVESAWPERFSMSVTADGITHRFQTSLVGAHWTNSILGAVAAARACGVSLADAARAVPSVQPVPGRMDPRPVPSGAVFLRDDFNGSLATYGSALEALKAARAQRKGLVITSVSDSTESWIQRLRRIATDAASVVDFIVFVGKPTDTKRGRSAALAAGMAEESVSCFESVRDASPYLKSFVRAGDLVLLRGLTADHIGRLYFDQVHPITCWVNRCPKIMACDQCEELYAIAPADETAMPRPIPDHAF